MFVVFGRGHHKTTNNQGGDVQYKPLATLAELRAAAFIHTASLRSAVSEAAWGSLTTTAQAAHLLQTAGLPPPSDITLPPVIAAQGSPTSRAQAGHLLKTAGLPLRTSYTCGCIRCAPMTRAAAPLAASSRGGIARKLHLR